MSGHILGGRVSAVCSHIRCIGGSAALEVRRVRGEHSRVERGRCSIPGLGSGVGIGFSMGSSNLCLGAGGFKLTGGYPYTSRPRCGFRERVVRSEVFDFLGTPGETLGHTIETAGRGNIFITSARRGVRLSRSRARSLGRRVSGLRIGVFNSTTISASCRGHGFRTHGGDSGRARGAVGGHSPIVIIILNSLTTFLTILTKFVPCVIGTFVAGGGRAITSSFVVAFISLFVVTLTKFVALLVLEVPLSRGFGRFGGLVGRLMERAGTLTPGCALFLSGFSSFVGVGSFGGCLHYGGGIFVLRRRVVLHGGHRCSSGVRRVYHG